MAFQVDIRNIRHGWLGRRWEPNYKVLSTWDEAETWMDAIHGHLGIGWQARWETRIVERTDEEIAAWREACHLEDLAYDKYLEALEEALLAGGDVRH